jgi:hypothetical protein
MTQHRGLNFSPLEQVCIEDLHAMQDRLYGELQRRAQSLVLQGSRLGLEEAPVTGVLSGLYVRPGTWPNLLVSAGEALFSNPSATGDESKVQLVRISPSEGLPLAGRAISLTGGNAPHGTLNRIDAVTIAPAVESLGGDATTVPIKVGSQIQMQAATVRSRASATISYTTGAPGANPSAPALPAGQLLLAYVYVPFAATTLAQLFISDSRVLALGANGDALVTGLLGGLKLSPDANPANFVLSGGSALVGGRRFLYPGPSAPLAWHSLHDATGVSSTGKHYVYLHHGAHSSIGDVSEQKANLIVSRTAPLADGTPGAPIGFPYALNPVRAGLATSAAGLLCIGRLESDDGSAISRLFSASDTPASESHEFAEYHSGAETHSATELHTGVETHTGVESHGPAAESHTGPESHAGTETHTGQAAFPLPTVATSPLRAQDGASGRIEVCTHIGVPPVSTTLYAAPGLGNIGDWSSSIGVVGVIVPAGCRVSNLRVQAGAPLVGGGLTVVLTNGAYMTTPNLRVAFGAGVSSGADLVNSHSPSAGDLLGFLVQFGAGITSCGGYLSISLEITKL